MLRTLLLALGLGAALPAAAETTDLARAVRTAIEGDRTGACLAVALIDGDRVQRAYECVDGAGRGRIDDRSAFEIGSVTKPMLATLLAMHIADGRASLDDPLARHLPEGTRVPEVGGEPIRLRHLVTHTSGLPALPPGFSPTNPADPYAGLTPAMLVGALGRTTPSAAPGARFEYSNFAAMLLSYVVSRLGGADVETQLRERLFAPAGMAHAHVATPPQGVRSAQGHLSLGRPTAAWTFHPELAGVGGVRATLDDMVRYVQASLAGSGDARLDAALGQVRTPVPTAATPGNVGMHWMLTPWKGGGALVAHEGGTYGFSSIVAFAPDAHRGVVILSDTALSSLGTVGGLAMHLMDPATPAPKPRRALKAPDDVLRALEGRYSVGGMGMRLWARDGALWAQADGQPALEFGYDSAGDFHPLAVDALLRPRRLPDGRSTFVFMQGGGAVLAQRTDAAAVPQAEAGARVEPSSRPVEDYVGTYPLAATFALTLSVRDGRLFVQGTGQPPIAVEPLGGDAFGATVVDAELRFERGADGRVSAVTLHQGGQALRGERRR